MKRKSSLWYFWTSARRTSNSSALNWQHTGSLANSLSNFRVASSGWRAMCLGSRADRLLTSWYFKGHLSRIFAVAGIKKVRHSEKKERICNWETFRSFCSFYVMALTANPTSTSFGGSKLSSFLGSILTNFAKDDAVSMTSFFFF